ncbi:MAG: GUN4 domain-containing protein [Hormoscilla sp.]
MMMSRLSTIMVGAAIVLVQPQVAFALSSEQVSQIAQSITVLIDGYQSGSGVIVDRKGDTYYVLTAAHVVNAEVTYLAIAPDGRRHRVYPANIKRIEGVDLAVVQFTSENSYSVGKLGNSESATISKRVYVAGAPEPSEALPSRTVLVTPGDIVGRQKPNQKGYALIYTNPTRRGMSGGPVLDEEGRVIGIHGQGDHQDGSKTGLNLAIPIESFLKSELSTSILSPDRPDETEAVTPTPSPNSTSPQLPTSTSSPERVEQAEAVTPTPPPNSTALPASSSETASSETATTPEVPSEKPLTESSETATTPQAPSKKPLTEEQKRRAAQLRKESIDLAKSASKTPRKNYFFAILIGFIGSVLFAFVAMLFVSFILVVSYFIFRSFIDVISRNNAADRQQYKVAAKYHKLRDLLKAGQWKEADRETSQVMLQVAGREKEGWFRVEDIENFPYEDLRTIDGLWVKCSNGRFGFSVQKRIWLEEGGKVDGETECRLADRVGWRVKEKWQIYRNLTFNLAAPAGSLPLLYRLDGCPSGWQTRVALLSRIDV